MAQERTRILDWLLEGDASIRWQVMRDLMDAREPIWRAEQERVATEGWGARLLEQQGDDLRWTPWIYGKKWISTTYTLVLLQRLGLPPSERILASCRLFFDEAQTPDGGIRASRVMGSGSETCVTGMVLAFLSWFRVNDPRRELLVEYLLANQMADGGWNCRQGASHSSFHTTISVLEGWREYADANGGRVFETKAAEARGREFMLRHRLFRSHQTGEVVSKQFLMMSFPPQWHFDVLRGLEYFWAARSLNDERLSDAVGIVAGKRRNDGRWPLQHRWPGEMWFEMERAGQPSRWNTLRATKVIEGWQGSASHRI